MYYVSDETRDDPYYQLAQAIVLLAVDDYNKTTKQLSKHKRKDTQYYNLIRQRDDALNFLRNQWCELLCNIEPQEMERFLNR